MDLTIILMIRSVTKPKVIMFMETRIPPLVVALLFATAMWVPKLISSPEGNAHPFLDTISLAVLALGTYFCIAGVVSFHRHKTTVDPRDPSRANSLVTSGIYRYSRNPMYLGFMLFLSALAITVGSFWSFLCVVGFVLYMNRFQIEPEEKALAAIFGEEFTQYKCLVRRWI